LNTDAPPTRQAGTKLTSAAELVANSDGRGDLMAVLLLAEISNGTLNGRQPRL
jgi:hypothetical protein